MSEKKFTAGPWTYEGKLHCHRVIHGSGFISQRYTGIGCGIELKANAQLIAAAPDLLNACISLVNTCDNAPPIDMIDYIINACNEARSAIAKAYGESP